MTGRFNGEYTFKALGQDWTLCFDFNALAEFEERSPGVTAMDMIREMDERPEEMRITDMRTMLWVGLLRHHPDVTLIQAGDIMSDTPEALVLGVGAALPPPDPASVGKEAPPGKSRGRKRKRKKVRH